MATATAPISIAQINKSYFVGEGFLNTIQKAVTFAVSNGNMANVIIPQEYTGSDAISAVSGGSATVFIIDQRNGQRQTYVWNGSYVPLDFIQKNGFTALGITAPPQASTAMWYDPTGTGGAGTGHLCIVGNPGQTIRPSLNVELQQTGNPGYGDIFMRLETGPDGHSATLINSELHAISQPQFMNIWAGQVIYSGGTAKGMYIWEKPDEDAIDFQGQTVTYPNAVNDQTIRINPDGGDVEIALMGEARFNNVSAEECLVANSPVRTFANTGDPGTGMTYPPAGIGVSTGEAWEEDSIDPATLAYVDRINTFQFDQIINGNCNVLGLNASNTVTTQTLTAATVTASQSLIATSNFTVMANAQGGPVNAPSYGLRTTWNLANGSGETDFINARTTGPGGGGFHWYNVDAGTAVSSSTQAAMILDGNNTLYVADGKLRLGIHPLPAGTPSIASDGGNIVMDNGSFFIPNHGIHAGLDGYGIDATGARLWDDGGSTFLDGGHNGRLLLNANTTAGLVAVHGTMSCDGNAAFNGATRAYGYEGYDTSRGNVQIGTGSDFGTPVVSFCRPEGQFDIAGWANQLRFSPSGGLTFVGIASRLDVYGDFNVSGAKNFRIPHPLKPDRDLVHSTLEGPEVAVFYRGENETVDGYVVINLPEYFEALTRPTDRTVLLTMIAEEEPPVFAQLAAGRVEDGKFKVYSSKPTIKFFWEVKAVRADIEQELEPLRPEDPPEALKQD